MKKFLLSLALILGISVVAYSDDIIAYQANLKDGTKVLIPDATTVRSELDVLNDRLDNQAEYTSELVEQLAMPSRDAIKANMLANNTAELTEEEIDEMLDWYFSDDRSIEGFQKRAKLEGESWSEYIFRSIGDLLLKNTLIGRIANTITGIGKKFDDHSIIIDNMIGSLQSITEGLGGVGTIITDASLDNDGGLTFNTITISSGREIIEGSYSIDVSSGGSKKVNVATKSQLDVVDEKATDVTSAFDQMLSSLSGHTFITSASVDATDGKLTLEKSTFASGRALDSNVTLDPSGTTTIDFATPTQIAKINGDVTQLQLNETELAKTINGKYAESISITEDGNGRYVFSYNEKTIDATTAIGDRGLVVKRDDGSSRVEVGSITIPQIPDDIVVEDDIKDFITADDIQTITGYLTDADVNGFVLKNDLPDLSKYATTNDIPDTSELAKEDNFDTDSWTIVDVEGTKDKKAEFNGGIIEIDNVSSYKTTNDIPDISNLAKESDFGNGWTLVNARGSNDKRAEFDGIIEIEDVKNYKKKSDIPPTSDLINTGDISDPWYRNPHVSEDFSEIGYDLKLNNDYRVFEIEDISNFKTTNDIPDTKALLNKWDYDDNRPWYWVSDEGNIKLKIASDYRITEIENTDSFKKTNEVPNTAGLANSDYMIDHHYYYDGIIWKFDGVKSIDDLSGYITTNEVPDTSELANSEDLTNAGFEKDNNGKWVFSGVTYDELPDLTDYVKKNEVEDGNNYANNTYMRDNGYSFNNELNKYVPALGTAIPKTELPDLSIYVKKDEVEDGNDYANNTYMRDNGYSFNVELNKYVPALGAAIPKTELPDLNNYVKKTEIEDGNDYATITDMRNAGYKYNTDSEKFELEGGILKSELPNLDDYAKISDIDGTEGYATESYMTDNGYTKDGDTWKFTNGILKSSLEGLDDYATIDDIPDDLADKIGDIAGFLTKEEADGAYAFKEHTHDEYLTEEDKCKCPSDTEERLLTLESEKVGEEELENLKSYSDEQDDIIRQQISQLVDTETDPVFSEVWNRLAEQQYIRDIWYDDSGNLWWDPIKFNGEEARSPKSFNIIDSVMNVSYTLDSGNTMTITNGLSLVDKLFNSSLSDTGKSYKPLASVEGNLYELDIDDNKFYNLSSINIDTLDSTHVGTEDISFPGTANKLSIFGDTLVWGDHNVITDLSLSEYVDNEMAAMLDAASTGNGYSYNDKQVRLINTSDFDENSPNTTIDAFIENKINQAIIQAVTTGIEINGELYKLQRVTE